MEELWDIARVADYLGVSQRTVYNRVRSGDLPAIRMGRLWRIRANDLQAWFDACSARRTRNAAGAAPTSAPDVAAVIAPGANAPAPRPQTLQGQTAPPAHSHRVAVSADLPQIVDIYNSTVPSRQVTADTHPVSVADRLPWFAEHDPAVHPLWVVEDAGRIAAWLSFSAFYGRPAYRHTAEISVYVNESDRGRGLGRYLIEAAIDFAPSIGVEALLGFIFGHNAPSLALFEKFGFEPWGVLPGVAELDGVKRDLVIVGRKV